MEDQLTFENFKEIPSGTVFAHGEAVDSPKGLNMMGSGKTLRWLAKKGHINDWVIYCHWQETSWPMVEREGDKVQDEKNIRNVLDVDDEMLKHYRH